MSELDFALDGLYAAGWWPSEGDHCLQAADNRWYPSQSMVLAYFRQSGIDLRQAACSPGRPSRSAGRCPVMDGRPSRPNLRPSPICWLSLTCTNQRIDAPGRRPGPEDPAVDLTPRMCGLKSRLTIVLAPSSSQVQDTRFSSW